MSPPRFSILHATRGRPEKAVKAMQMWRDMAQDPYKVEYILCVDSDDESISRLRLPDAPNGFGFMSLVEYDNRDGKGSAPAWNFAAQFSRGEILIQAQDDVEPAFGWDTFIGASVIARGGGDNWPDKPLIIAVGDGYRKDALLCTAIMNRARYEQQCHFLYPGYSSVFSDDEFTIRAFADERDGRCIVIPCRDLIFKHQHHYHTPDSVPWDETYKRQNAQENYETGRKLFEERNKHLIDMGFKTWK